MKEHARPETRPGCTGKSCKRDPMMFPARMYSYKRGTHSGLLDVPNKGIITSILDDMELCVLADVKQNRPASNTVT